MKRNAFSLLEVIIATAVLAASAMVLSSLIGLGSRYGNRAEERTLALSQAESLMDEFLAGLGNSDNRLEETSGELPGPPPRGFRISATPFEIGSATANNIGAMPNGPSVNARSGGLLRVTVELFETAGLNVSSEAEALVELSRLIRVPQSSSVSAPNGNPMGAMSGADPSVQGLLP